MVLSLLLACTSPAEQGSETNRPGRLFGDDEDGDEEEEGVLDTTFWEDTAANAEEEEDCDVGLNKGQCAPDFTLTSSKYTEVSLSDFKGKRVIVVGSATW